SSSWSVGSHVITASYAGDPNYIASASTNLNQVVKAGPATHLAVYDFEDPTTAGDAQLFIVEALDASGNRATSYTGTIHFTSSDGQAVLPADYTFTAGNAGIKAFSGTLKTAGEQSITATDTANASITGSQVEITVEAGALAAIVISPADATIEAGETQA